MGRFDPRRALSALSDERPLFHSEADFQHAFAWKVQEMWPGVRVRLEVPLRFDGRSNYLDVEIAVGGKRSGVELKYLTAGLSAEVNWELFQLSNHGAQVVRRYDVIKDIARLERAVERGRIDDGWVVTLTNDSSYWASVRNQAVSYAQFALHEGRPLHGKLAWGAAAGPGTTRLREAELRLNGRYMLNWSDYSSLTVARAGRFRSLVIQVGVDAIRP